MMSKQKTKTQTQSKKIPRRDVTGVFLLNKPLGLSSNQVVQKVRWLYRAEKAGHTGSLDPLASGLLPICLGEATKFSQYLLAADKHYDFTIRLGEVTTTGDKEGEVVATQPVPELSLQQLQEVVATFMGEISQVPPMFSAIKYQGQPLYKLARQGKEIEREARSITIHALKIVKMALPDVHLSVHCSKGTYVRSLAVDIGEKLGCGAHVTRLHRTAVGSIDGSEMLGFDALESMDELQRDHCLKPMDGFLEQMPIHCLLQESTRKIKLGQKIKAPAGVPENVLLRLFSFAGAFLGIGECVDGVITPKRLMR